jgi:hypothetical protein
MIEVSPDLASDLVHAVQTGTLRGIATLLNQARDLDQAAIALPHHAETLRTAAIVLRQMATNGRAVDKALSEVVDLLRAERIEQINTQKPALGSIAAWLAHDTDQPNR